MLLSVTICKPASRHDKGQDIAPLAVLFPAMSDDAESPTYAWRVGRRIAAVRSTYGLRQEDFAKSLGVARNTLANWETGQKLAPVAPMLRLMATYRVGLNWIFAAAAMDLPRGPIGDAIYTLASDDGAHLEAIEAPVGVPGLGTIQLPPDVRKRGLHEAAAPRVQRSRR